jgi:hypothetical protein
VEQLGMMRAKRHGVRPVPRRFEMDSLSRANKRTRLRENESAAKKYFPVEPVSVNHDLWLHH